VRQTYRLHSPTGFYLPYLFWTAANNKIGVLGECMGLQPHPHCDEDIHPCAVSAYIPRTKLPHSVFRCLGSCGSLRRLGNVLECVYLQSHRFFMGQIHRRWTLYEPARHMGYKCGYQHCTRRGHLSDAIVHRPDPSNLQITEGRLSGHVCAGR
jgi:hypothetical protein